MTEYTGFKDIVLTNPNDINALYDPKTNETFGCLENEYLIARDEKEEVIDLFKCKDGRLAQVPYKAIESKFAGKIKPRNIQQKLGIDMLYDTDITIKILTGKFGTGKDLLMSSAAIDLIEKGYFDKLVYVRNNIEVKNSKPIGHLPGSSNEKLLPFAMCLADHVGGVDGLSYMIEKGVVEVVHLGFIRGRDIKNSIILCSEAENLTKEHIQLLIGRVGEGSSLWINGDFKQTDLAIFERNNGLMIAIDRLKGHPRFGYVKLLKTERSETAAMADLLD
jgi:PhoH-like ATPase